ncbi:Acg family FMN-binding oxidoreductase [Hoeflea sp.]|uniref:Acg family FMN-binding oxidoreductase n=1 Tax=Hoeflea sp. TaxID=1940281 RepID=UPI00374968BA
MQRRQFLSILGGGVVLAAAAGTGFALTRTPTDALAPWSAAGGSAYAEPRLRALSYAILAPNPHNRQPWQVELKGEDTVVLRVDLERLLPHTDPFSRQITIGLGCFLELMVMAAAETGHRVEIEPFPEGADSERLTTAPVAIARFVEDPDIEPDPLFVHVMARRSNKEPFDTARPVSDQALAAVLASPRHSGRVGGTNAPEEVGAWRKLTEQALQIEIDTPRTYRESVDLFRIGKAEINANPDGIDFSGPMFESLALFGQFSREVALDRTSAGFKQGVEAVLENTRTAMAHVWMVTDGNSRTDQIAAGRDWLRANLAATAQGLGFHPLSQALQEYPEMAAIYQDVHTRLAPDGGTVQMLVRLGYGPEIQVSPRWPLEAKLREA